MGLRFIRKPSDTPNIGNYDDARLFRYAVGGYNGYVKNYGSELNYTVSGNVFTIQSGIAVLQGYETEVDSNGISITVDSSPTRRYYTIYYEVNLAAQNTKIDSVYDTVTYPPITLGDDLTKNITGTARMELYRFSAQSGVISAVTKMITPIEYMSERTRTKEIVSEVARINYAEITNLTLFGGYELSEDTIPTERTTLLSMTTPQLQSVTLYAGWYEVTLEAGGGGGGLSAAGGQGGYTNRKFYIPYTAACQICSGGGGDGSQSGTTLDFAGGGGGGGSYLIVPTLGIAIVATGGGGGGGGSEFYGGGGGGGMGGGGAGRGMKTSPMGGASGNYAKSYGDGGGMGGGQSGFRRIQTDDNIFVLSHGMGGGVGGNGGIGNAKGSAGGNNCTTALGGALNDGPVCAKGGDGRVFLYKLG